MVIPRAPRPRRRRASRNRYDVTVIFGNASLRFYSAFDAVLTPREIVTALREVADRIETGLDARDDARPEGRAH